MSLIKQIYEATTSGDLVQPFTTQEFKQWMGKCHILKGDGEEYAEASIEAILSNSDTKNNPTSNRNIKALSSRVNNHGIKEYWFDE